MTRPDHAPRAREVGDNAGRTAEPRVQPPPQPTRSLAGLTAPSVLALQRTAGNRAVRLMLQRTPGGAPPTQSAARSLQRSELPVALDQTLAKTALAMTPLQLPTADLINWASALDAKLMRGEIPGRFHRSAVASQLLEVHGEIRERMRRAPLDADLVPVEPGLPWGTGDPLAGTLEVFPPFDHVGAWREIAAEAPLPRHRRLSDPVAPTPPSAESSPSGEIRHAHWRGEHAGRRFGAGEATRAFQDREQAEAHLGSVGRGVEGLGWAAEVAAHLLSPHAAFVLGLASPVLALVLYWLGMENIYARHEADARLFGARTAMWGMLGTAERDVVPQPLEGRHLLYGARLHVPNWYDKRNQVASHLLLDWQEVQEHVDRGCDDIAGRLQATIRTESENYTRTALAAGRTQHEVRADIQAGLKAVLRHAGTHGLDQIRQRYATLAHVSH